MTWARLDDAFSDHPKIIGLTDKAFRVHVTSILYCSRLLTDGVLPKGAEVRMGATVKVVKELVTAGLWDEIPGGWTVHDYLDYNPPADEVLKSRKAISESRAAGGRAAAEALTPDQRRERAQSAAHARWDANSDANSDAKAILTACLPDAFPVPVPLNTLSNERVGRTRKKPLVPLTVAQRIALEAEFADIPHVADEIDFALGHEAHRKISDENLYVRRWLRRNRTQSSPKNGASTALPPRV